RDNLTLEPWEVEELFLNALTTQYDPHTSFFSKQSMEEFEIMMRNSLCGIGAVLTTEDGYCTIREIMPGSPVERSGKFSVGDRIVAVAPGGNGEQLTDVVGMRLNRIVRMLRGEKGVPVTLLVESGNDHSRQLITLVRDEVKLTEQLASAKIFDVPDGDSAVPVGVISLPSFYGKDRSDKTAFSTSEDVKELLGKLKKAKVKAIVLDLRRNGGGYLNEAIDLLELFVGPGVPAVLTQGSGGRTSKLITGGTLGMAKSLFSDTPEWTGPVVVLVSKLSASASEIVAGALQDNRRALIVGDPQTHGKGSVQEVIPFKAYDSSQEASIKLTRSKWYAPSGNSIQIKGVSSDVVTPSIYSVLPVGEGDLDRPLPWDSVPSVLGDEIPEWLSAPVSPELIEILAENSRRRQAELPEFLTHHRTIAWMDEREKDKSLPLSISERLALRDNDKAFYELVKKEYTDLSLQTGYNKTEIKLDSAIEQEKESEDNAAKKKSLLKPNQSALPGMSGGNDDDWPDYDVLLREAVRIAADWVELVETEKVKSPVREREARSSKAPSPRK
ncbi:MAG: carboxy terminal-processing peptidase, partial [Opitutales bacterium]|nr:carboxy terminal-processing peptidase [Opitutales bacterium]